MLTLLSVEEMKALRYLIEFPQNGTSWHYGLWVWSMMKLLVA